MLELLILSFIAGAAREATQAGNVCLRMFTNVGTDPLDAMQRFYAMQDFYRDAYDLDRALIEALS